MGPLLGLLIVGLALWGLHSMLRDTSAAEIVAALSALPPVKAALALGCTALSYLVLTLYDRLSLRWLGLRWPWRRSAPGTALAYALGNVSFNALLIAGTLRYAAWRAHGVQPGQAATIAVFASLGFWLGYAALGGLLFGMTPLRATLRPVGLALLLAITLYPLLAWRLPAFRIGRRQVALPPPRLCLGQVAVGMLDLIGISGVLWLLLPRCPASPTASSCRLSCSPWWRAAPARRRAGWGCSIRLSWCCCRPVIRCRRPWPPCWRSA